MQKKGAYLNITPEYEAKVEGKLAKFLTAVLCLITFSIYAIRVAKDMTVYGKVTAPVA